MPSVSRIMAEEDIFKMTYDKLRKELKKKRISAAGKKSDLQFRLVEYLQNQKEATDEQETIEESEEPEEQQTAAQDEPMDTEEQEDPVNRTFTVEEENQDDRATKALQEGTPTNPVNLVLDEDVNREMCANLGIDLANFEVKSRTRVHRASARKSLRETVASEPPKEEVPQPEETLETHGVTPVRQSQRTPTRGGDRFAFIHAKEMEKEETLGERRVRMKKRHEDLTDNVPDAIKRLATPKSVKKRSPLERFGASSAARTWNPTDPTQMTFRFGSNAVDTFSDLANNREETGECSSSSTVKKPASRARAHVDVKQLTRIPGSSRTPRSVKPVTRTEDSTFVEYMSTPKGTTPSRAPKRGGYTPFAGKKVFVDTTQLTDREYTLASEEGLIPGKPATKTSAELRQMESKKRRDDIIALKRKMNMK
ncbi:unnamed protein product [Caenorhabditis sp. 36 PRJEB53466]|nr:unnamed protein product [Caenorhabditis sp. 36 PRJEB53466]